MDPGVGTPCCVCHDRCTAQALENALKLGLNRSTFALALPADETAAVEVHHREECLTHRAGI
jgi:hypothetical protein